MNNILYILTFICLFSGQNAYAEPYLTKTRVGLELEGFADPNTFAKGGLIGLNASQYVYDSNYRVGLGLFTGSSTGGRIEQDNLTYGGIDVGYDTVFKSLFHIEGDLLVGYGYGALQKGVVVQPSVGAGLVVVDGWRAVFVVGYFYSHTLNISGVTFGIKFDNKSVGNGYGTSQ